MLKYYKNYLSNVSKTPEEEFKDLTQAYVDSVWNDTTLLSDVKEEKAIGTFEFISTQVQKSTITQFTINGIKDPQYYRELLIRDCDANKNRGLFYQFDGSYWIVYNPSQEEIAHNYIYVRQCNNLIKWIDGDSGKYIEQPCVIEERLEASRVSTVGNYISNANNALVLWAQGNNDTRKIRTNDRFIFNGRPFKVLGYNNSLQDTYVDGNTTMLFFDVALDTIEPNDDIVNNIANRYDYDYKLDIIDAPREQISGFKGRLICNVYLNDKVSNLPIVWACTNNKAIVNKDTGEYQLSGVDGDIATISATVGLITTSVDIKIVGEVTSESKIVINPNITELKQYRSEDIVVGLYIDGVLQSDLASYVIDGDDKCYTFVDNGDNKYTIANLLPTSKNVDIEFTIGDISETMSIELTSML